MSGTPNRAQHVREIGIDNLKVGDLLQDDPYFTLSNDKPRLWLIMKRNWPWSLTVHSFDETTRTKFYPDDLKHSTIMLCSKGEG